MNKKNTQNNSHREKKTSVELRKKPRYFIACIRFHITIVIADKVHNKANVYSEKKNAQQKQNSNDYNLKLSLAPVK